MQDKRPQPAPEPLPAEALCRRAAPENLPFQTTAELTPLSEMVGHGRAQEAIRFAVGVDHPGFNLYLMGPAGTGKYSLAREFLEQHAATKPTPEEWCYRNNFRTPEQPLSLRLPPARGSALRDDMRALVEDLHSAIPAAFESEDYRARKNAIEQELKERQDAAFSGLAEESAQNDVALVRTPTGIIMAPMRDGEVMNPADFENLPESEHALIERTIGDLQEKLKAVLLEMPKWQQETRNRLRDLNHEIATFAASHLMEELRKKYLDLPQVLEFLDEVRQDISDHVGEFLTPQEHPLAALMGEGMAPLARKESLSRRYQVNVLVDHGGATGAPVVYEDHPTYQNLLGQVQYMAHLGALTTDFTLIRCGALHRANGGFLILDAQKLLMQPYSWDALKRSLRSGQIRIESVGEMLGLVSTVSLQPRPMPLQTRVLLVGDRELYYLLCALDAEFQDLFKVAADFEEHLERTPETETMFARWIATLGRQDQLRPLDRFAVARVIEYSSRAAEDSQRLLMLRRTLRDLLIEADHWAHQRNHETVQADDVQRAVDAITRRKDRLRERVFDSYVRGTLQIDTAGSAVGQVNGLSMVTLPGYAFGHPTRITARVRLGRGEVVDIEREVELGGPIHSKGVLILSGFLGQRYAADHPLSLHASLVFEQSYGGVEGDSASSAELYALLSALAGLPLKQSFAVTGSVNQHGQIQAIGGVNEKIEGFFDLCQKRGALNGHGVLIPRSNVPHLMLRQDVVEAARAGQFLIYAIETIDQGMELLTGVAAGERDAAGAFPPETVNHRVEARLLEFAAKRAARKESEGTL